MKFQLPLLAMLFSANQLFAQNVGIGTNTPSNRLHVTSSAASSFNATIYGLNTGSAGSGIFGVSNASGTYGVQGFSTSGIGVYGNSSDYRAIYGSTGTGTALYGYSSEGYGLQTVGKVKISGGNTNPVIGAVLTSIDGSGNAVWKPEQISFSVARSRNQSIPAGVDRKIEFQNERYDFGGGFVPYSGTTTEASSVFTAPVAGVYHFSASVPIKAQDFVYNIDGPTIMLVKNGTTIAYAIGSIKNFSGGSQGYPQIDQDLKLNSNDKVWIAISHSSGGNITVSADWSDNGETAWFSGHLLFAL
jgi:hypothetical protein